MSQRYGSATAQDLYRLFIKSGVFDQYDRFRHWELIDDDDASDPVSDDWYVIADIGDDRYGTERRRLDAARLWAAILACASGRIKSVPLRVGTKCDAIIRGGPDPDIYITADDADVVMQIVVYGQVEFN